MTDNIEAKWIWLGNCVSGVNRYVEFRREFDLEVSTETELELSVDTNFAAWVNGRFIGGGQFADYPQAKTFSAMDIADLLQTGRNVFTVLVHYCGVGHFSYIPGQAGLMLPRIC